MARLNFVRHGFDDRPWAVYYDHDQLVGYVSRKPPGVAISEDGWRGEWKACSWSPPGGIGYYRTRVAAAEHLIYLYTHGKDGWKPSEEERL